MSHVRVSGCGKTLTHSCMTLAWRHMHVSWTACRCSVGTHAE